MGKFSFQVSLASVRENHHENGNNSVLLVAPADDGEHRLCNRIDLMVSHPSVKLLFAQEKVGRRYRIVIEEIEG